MWVGHRSTSLVGRIPDGVAWMLPVSILAGLARARGRTGGRKPKVTPEVIDKAQRMYDSRKFSMAEIAHTFDLIPMTIYRNIRTDQSVGQKSKRRTTAASRRSR